MIHPLSCMEHTAAQQIELGSAVHVAFEQLELDPATTQSAHDPKKGTNQYYKLSNPQI
jgi:hypothetical protein